MREVVGGRAVTPTIREIAAAVRRHFVAVFSVFLVGVGLAQALARYALVSYGPETLLVDVTTVWRPLATRVLAGAPLYAPATWDNKPPLFQFVNLLAARTGSYELAFYAAIGLCNGVGALLLWLWLKRNGRERVGVAAAVLYLGTVPAAYGTLIGPRPFAQVALLLAVLARRAVAAGAFLAVAGLFTQFSVLAAPVLLARRTNGTDTRERLAWTLRFAAGCVVVATVSYGAVGALWGWESLVRGVEYTVVAAGTYSDRFPSAWNAPVYWAAATAVHATTLVHLLALGAVGAVLALRDEGPHRIERECLLLSAFLLVPLVLRPAEVYWFPATPFLSVLAVVGIGRFVRWGR